MWNKKASFLVYYRNFKPVLKDRKSVWKTSLEPFDLRKAYLANVHWERFPSERPHSLWIQIWRMAFFEEKLPYKERTAMRVW